MQDTWVINRRKAVQARTGELPSGQHREVAIQGVVSAGSEQHMCGQNKSAGGYTHLVNTGSGLCRESPNTLVK